MHNSAQEIVYENKNYKSPMVFIKDNSLYCRSYYYDEDTYSDGDLYIKIIANQY